VITNGQVGKVDIAGLEDFSIYEVYYVTANEYPLSTVLAANTTSLQVSVFSLFGERLVANLMMTVVFIFGFLWTPRF